MSGVNVLDGGEAHYQLILQGRIKAVWSRILQFLPAQARDIVLGIAFVFSVSTRRLYIICTVLVGGP